MSARKFRKTGSVYKIAATNDAILERELFGISSRADLRSTSEISNAVNASSIQESMAIGLLNEIDSSAELANEDVSDYDSEDDDVQHWVTIEDDSDESENENFVESYPSTVPASKWDGVEIQECIRCWALSTHQTHEALNGLLEILRKKTQFKFPKDAQTLLQTQPGTQQIVRIAGGEYWYHGIATCLLQYFGRVQPKTTSFSLNVSIDGLPLHNSGLTQFWPILINIQEEPNIPCMIVAIFCGSTKPLSTEEYLRPFVTELKDLMENGIIIADKLIQIRVRAFIADSPARAFIKGTANYNAKSGCHKCTVLGEYHHGFRVVIRVIFAFDDIEGGSNEKESPNEAGSFIRLSFFGADMMQLEIQFIKQEHYTT
ncbi:uncharacterized protein LOC128712760 [Anopheles marshallii]|uniref:uncharacterized protein LOC128712760 n=1 Tax=Anopheles marshallii TaxID=1521116 RepID=UPI00237A0E24|nr:uncharacterized protein LOC128712760 [Anopheles marshallii]